MYCVADNSIMLNLFGFSGVDDEILNLKDKNAAKIDAKQLFEILNLRFKTFNDKSGGSVAFVKNCTTFDLIQAEFLKQISDMYKGISVKNLRIRPQNSLPKNFNTYKFKSIHTAKNFSSNGNFRAVFYIDDLSEKSIYFSFHFDATMPVFVALSELHAGQILSTLDYQKIEIDFDKFDKNSLQKFINSKLMAKLKIKAGDILLNQHFARLSLIKKGDRVNALIKEGGASIIIEVVALSGGELGDEILVKTKDKKSFKATIVSKNQVLIK